MTNACCHRTVSAVFAGSVALAPLVSPGAACFLDAVLASLPYLAARTGFSTLTRSVHSLPTCVRSPDSSFHQPAPKLIALGKHHPPATFAIAPNSQLISLLTIDLQQSSIISHILMTLHPRFMYHWDEQLAPVVPQRA